MTRENEVFFDPEETDNSEKAKKRFSNLERLGASLDKLCKILEDVVLNGNIAYYEGDRVFALAFAFSNRLRYLLYPLILDPQKTSASMQLELDNQESEILQDLSDKINEALIEGLAARIENGTLTVEFKVEETTSSPQD